MSKEFEINRKTRMFRISKKLLLAVWKIKIGIHVTPSVELLELIRELKRSDDSMDERIKQAFDSLQEASRVVNELNQTIATGGTKLEELRRQYVQYSKLAAVELEKAKPLIQQLEEIGNKRKTRERLERLAISIISGLFVFILGIILGPTLKTWLHIG